MAGFGNTTENDLLKLYFNATAIANLADNAASAPNTQLFVALHTADPGEAGDQTTSETAYTSYARVAVNRTSGGFTVATNSVVNAATITFPTCGVTGSTITHFSVGLVTSSASKIVIFGPVGNIANVGEFTSVTADTITVPNIAQTPISIAIDDRVSFYPTPAGVLPTGMTEGTVYFVKTISGNDMTVSTTSGGATLDLTTVGSGVMYKHGLLVVSTNVIPTFAAGALSAKMD